MEPRHPGTQARAQWEEGTRATPPKPSFLAALSMVSCPGGSEEEPGSQGAGARSAGPALSGKGKAPAHRCRAASGPHAAQRPQNNNKPALRVTSDLQILLGWSTERQTGGAVPAPRQSRAAQQSATRVGTQYTHTHSPGGASNAKARAAQQGSPGPLDTRGARGQGFSRSC